MARNNKSIPELNASSMADIAFLLLIFFLVATTMDTDKGLQRVLPPMPDEKDERPIDVKQRNLFPVFVNRFDQINAAGELLTVRQLKDKAIEFIVNPLNAEHLPEKEMVDIELIGEYPVSKGVISLQNDRGTSYSTYIAVQNELTRAFNEVRDALANREFGKNFLELTQEQRDAVQKAVPLKISEAEPRNIEGGR